MLRTLAINSNKKCVKFWCFDSFLITKANLKLRRVNWNPCKEYTRTVRPDTPSEGIQTTYPGRNYTRLPPICTRLPPICTRMCATILHPAAAHFPPGCSCPEFRSRMGEEAFQLLRTDISGSSDSVYPDGEQPFCRVLRCSPEAS